MTECFLTNQLWVAHIANYLVIVINGPGLLDLTTQESGSWEDILVVRGYQVICPRTAKYVFLATQTGHDSNALRDIIQCIISLLKCIKSHIDGGLEFAAVILRNKLISCQIFRRLTNQDRPVNVCGATLDAPCNIDKILVRRPEYVIIDDFVASLLVCAFGEKVIMVDGVLDVTNDIKNSVAETVIEIMDMFEHKYGGGR